jgi:hypothetical protein
MSREWECPPWSANIFLLPGKAMEMPMPKSRRRRIICGQQKMALFQYSSRYYAFLYIYYYLSPVLGCKRNSLICAMTY